MAWAALAWYGGYPAHTTISYDYFRSVVYPDDSIYVNGENAGTPAEYAYQASAIATKGMPAPRSRIKKYSRWVFMQL